MLLVALTISSYSFSAVLCPSEVASQAKLRDTIFRFPVQFLGYDLGLPSICPRCTQTDYVVVENKGTIHESAATAVSAISSSHDSRDPVTIQGLLRRDMKAETVEDRYWEWLLSVSEPERGATFHAIRNFLEASAQRQVVFEWWSKHVSESIFEDHTGFPDTFLDSINQLAGSPTKWPEVAPVASRRRSSSPKAYIPLSSLNDLSTYLEAIPGKNWAKKEIRRVFQDGHKKLEGSSIPISIPAAVHAEILVRLDDSVGILVDTDWNVIGDINSEGEVKIRNSEGRPRLGLPERAAIHVFPLRSSVTQAQLRGVAEKFAEHLGVIP